MGTIDNPRHNLDVAIVCIQRDPSISDKNTKAMMDFSTYSIAQGLSVARALRYINDLKCLNRFLKKDFEDTTREDIERVLTELEKSNYAEYTKHGFRIVIRKFYKWLRKTEDFPPEVKWYDIKEPKNKIRLPEEMLTEQEIIRLINAARNSRDRALVAVLYESGCRMGEMMFLRLKHVKYDKYGAQIVVEGKTGFRRVRLVSSAPYLTAWMNEHPNKDDPESHLWVSITKGHLTTYAVYRNTLKTLARRSGVKKAVNPHNFRHSRATYLANRLTEAQMKEIFGWTKNSDMAAVYVHLSGRDVDKAILKTHGINIEDDEQEISPLEPKKCANCSELNPATNIICNSCNLPLGPIQKKDSIDNLLEDEEIRKLLLNRIQN